MKYYKFLSEENKGEYSNFDYTPYLPKGDQPGEWLPEIKQVKLCVTGYHACEAKDLQCWIGAQLFEVEFSGKVVPGFNKVVGCKMRFVRKIDTWNDKTARLFACWCAEHILPIYEREYQYDDRPRKAIETAKRYANGEATQDELSVAWDKAKDAVKYAEAANWTAACAASRAAEGAARDSAWYAAKVARWAASWDTSRHLRPEKLIVPEKLIEMLGL